MGYYGYYEEEFDISETKFLYQLRHSFNLCEGNIKILKSKIKTIQPERIEKLYYSDIHGSTELSTIKDISDDKFDDFIKLKEAEAEESENAKMAAREKNYNLIHELENKRTEFCGLGTNKTKRRLNKLATTNPIAEALRVALEIEDKNITAKGTSPYYKDKVYELKYELILKLYNIFRINNWESVGIQETDNFSATHIIYFDIAGCEQISFHFSPKRPDDFIKYRKEWDNKPNSTLGKLEKTIYLLLNKNNLLD